MRKVLRYILSVSVLLSVLIFCVSAAAGVPESSAFVDKAFSEPVAMILFGVGLIVFSSFIKRRLIR